MYAVHLESIRLLVRLYHRNISSSTAIYHIQRCSLHHAHFLTINTKPIDFH